MLTKLFVALMLIAVGQSFFINVTSYDNPNCSPTSGSFSTNIYGDGKCIYNEIFECSPDGSTVQYFEFDNTICSGAPTTNGTYPTSTCFSNGHGYGMVSCLYSVNFDDHPIILYEDDSCSSDSFVGAPFNLFDSTFCLNGESQLFADCESGSFFEQRDFLDVSSCTGEYNATTYHANTCLMFDEFPQMFQELWFNTTFKGMRVNVCSSAGSISFNISAMWVLLGLIIALIL